MIENGIAPKTVVLSDEQAFSAREPDDRSTDTNMWNNQYATRLGQEAREPHIATAGIDCGEASLDVPLGIQKGCGARRGRGDEE